MSDDYKFPDWVHGSIDDAKVMTVSDIMMVARERAIADVIDLIRSERVTYPSGQIDMPVEELVEMIQALLQPST